MKHTEEDVKLEDLKEPIPESWYFKFKEYIFSKRFKTVKSIKDDDISHMFFAFLNRSRFKYQALDIVEYFLRCFCLKNLSKNRRDTSYK